MEQKLRPRTNKLILFLSCLIVPSIFIAITLKVAWHDIIKGDLLAIGTILLFFTLSFIPYLLVAGTYLYEDLSKQLFIDREKKILKLKQKGKVTVISTQDIEESYHVKVVSRPFRLFNRLRVVGFEYILLVLKERERVFITNLLADPNEIISLFLLQCKEIEATVPLLDRGLGSGVLTKEELEKGISEFQQRFQPYPTERLEGIIQNKRDYAPAAIEAARKILEERRIHNDHN